MSDIKWYTSLPVHWNEQRIKYLFRIISGNGFPVEMQGRSNEKYPFAKAGTISASNKYLTSAKDTVSEEDVSYNGFNVIPAGSIVLPKIGEALKKNSRAITVENCCIDNNCQAMVPKNIEIGFAYYLLSIIDMSWHDNKGTIPSINNQSLKDDKAPYPPLSEQQAIVSYLDAKCAAVDEAIERHKKIIEKLEGYKKASTVKAVTKGIRGSTVEDSGEEWLGAIPKHWSVKRNWALFRETNERGNDELPILTVSINSGISDRELSDDESDRVFARSEDRSKYKRVQPGDIAYNMMRAWQGAFGAARVDGMVSPAYITARPIVEMDTRYFEYLMRTNIAAKEFEKYSRGITDFRLRLYYPEFKNIRVCVPPIDEQREIANFLDDLYAKTEQAVKQNNTIVTKLEEYRKSIIYNAVTGKIDCRAVQ